MQKQKPALWQFPPYDSLHAKSIRNCDAKMNIWVGSVRAGKTVCSLFAWLWYLQREAPDGMYVITGTTLDTIRRNILEPLCDFLPASFFSYSIGRREALFGNKKIQLIGGQNKVSQNKLRGLTCAGAYCDEITTTHEEFFMMLLSRLSVPNARLFGTTNPESPTHWFKEKVLDIEGKDLKVFNFTMDDNPHLPEDYKEHIKSRYTGHRYDRLILGLWVAASGAIYDMLGKHHFVDTTSQFKQCKKFWISIDYGTYNPCTFGLYGKVNGAYYLFKEYYWDSRKEEQKKTDVEYVDDMIKFIGKLDISVIFIDPSAASFKLSLKRKGLPIRSAQNDVLDGIQVVSEHLRNNTYLMDKTCINTEREYYGYVWSDKGSKESPAKERDHACDRDRYFLYTIAPKNTKACTGFEAL